MFQVADVHKPLLSISGCADMGFDCHLGDKGGHLLDKQAGENIPLGRRDNLVHHESVDTPGTRDQY